MYDRAPRTFGVTLGCTDPRLGPGCYELPSRTRQLRGGYAPFLSLASRGLGSIYQNSENDVPGPGYYEIDRSLKIVKGGHSPQYKEQRFKQIYDDTPGPGTYSQPPSIGQDVSRVKKPSKVPSAQKLAGSIKIFRKSDAPSIPSQGQSYGYEEAEDGTLIKHNPPARDNTLGPAYYRTKSNETYPTMKYKGVHFGNLTEKRHEFKPREGPGPADYDVIQESAVHYENVNIRKEDQKKCDLYVPRYHEEIVLQEEKKGTAEPGILELILTPNELLSMDRVWKITVVMKKGCLLVTCEMVGGENLERYYSFKTFKKTLRNQNAMLGVPGPGQYDIKSQFEKIDNAAQSEAHHAPFLSLAQRFAPVKSFTPAPGTYNETRSALESLKKASKTRHVPFGHTSVRFRQDYRMHKTPDPAFYNILNYSIAAQSLKKAVLEKKKKGAFGSTVPRLLYLVKREAFTTPGPADYQVLIKLNS
ncbi:Sperm-tail PG-rich repeat-containing protein 2 [Varanus komodoensis]|nr:Sperm-tail PG-rich repeat-containing protein 2 [Varanus komodoensis]